MKKLTGTISNDGVVSFGQRPKPRTDVLIIVPSGKTIPQFEAIVREFVSTRIGENAVVRFANCLEDIEYTLLIITDGNSKWMKNFRNVIPYTGIDKQGRIAISTNTYAYASVQGESLFKSILEQRYNTCVEHGLF